MHLRPFALLNWRFLPRGRALCESSITHADEDHIHLMNEYVVCMSDCAGAGVLVFDSDQLEFILSIVGVRTPSGDGKMTRAIMVDYD